MQHFGQRTLSHAVSPLPLPVLSAPPFGVRPLLIPVPGKPTTSVIWRNVYDWSIWTHSYRYACEPFHHSVHAAHQLEVFQPHGLVRIHHHRRTPFSLLCRRDKGTRKTRSWVHSRADAGGKRVGWIGLDPGQMRMLTPSILQDSRSESACTTLFRLAPSTYNAGNPVVPGPVHVSAITFKDKSGCGFNTSPAP